MQSDQIQSVQNIVIVEFKLMWRDTSAHCAATPRSHDANGPDVFNLTWLHFAAVDSTQQTNKQV